MKIINYIILPIFCGTMFGEIVNDIINSNGWTLIGLIIGILISAILVLNFWNYTEEKKNE